MVTSASVRAPPSPSESVSRSNRPGCREGEERSSSSPLRAKDLHAQCLRPLGDLRPSREAAHREKYHHEIYFKSEPKSLNRHVCCHDLWPDRSVLCRDLLLDRFLTIGCGRSHQNWSGSSVRHSDGQPA